MTTDETMPTDQATNPSADEGRVAVTGGEVWWQKVAGGSGVPLLLLHGGPGASSLGSVQTLAHVQQDRPVYLYDQLGSGRSDRPSHTGLWTVERFVAELAQVRAALGLERVHLLGHSWGSMLATSYLLTEPEGVESVVLSSPCLDARRWARDQLTWLAEMPHDVRQTIERAEAEGSTDSAAYQEATLHFYRRHLCRLDPWPAYVVEGVADINHEVYGHMWGASEFTVSGTLQDFDVTGRLAELHLPALFVCGEYDEARPETVREQAALLPGARFEVIDDASHMTSIEAPDVYWRTVREFLAGTGC